MLLLGLKERIRRHLAPRRCPSIRWTALWAGRVKADWSLC